MSRRKTFLKIAFAELSPFWKYLLSVVLVYAVIFFSASFSFLLSALNFLAPLIYFGALLFFFRLVIAYRQWQRRTAAKKALAGRNIFK